MQSAPATAADWPHGEGEMARRIRALDWAATPLGPIAQWQPCLRTTVDLVLASGHAMMLAWGPERTLLYNDLYAPMLGERHPAALGLPVEAAWPDVWEAIAPLVHRVFAGDTVRFDRLPLSTTRHGRTEETWWRFSYSPVRDETGAVAGLLNVPADITAWVHAERERDAAHARARENEARYRSIFASMQDGFYLAEAIFDSGGRCVDLFYHDENAAAVRMTGQSFKGRLLSELGGYEPYWCEIFGDTARTGAPHDAQMYAAPDRTWYDFHTFKPPAARENELAVVFRDITLQRSVADGETRQTFLLKLSDALRGEATAEAIGALAIRSLADHLSLDRCYIVSRRDGGSLWDTGPEARAPGLSAMPPVLDQDDFPEGLRIISAGTLVIDDTAARTDFSDAEKQGLQALGFGALLMATLRTGEGTPDWSMVAASTSPRRWTSSEIQLVEDVGERTWAAIQRARVEAALRESERIRRVALTGGRMGSWRWDRAADLIQGDEQFMALWGLPPSQDALPRAAFATRMSAQSAAELTEVVARAAAVDEEFSGVLEIVGGPTAGDWVRWQGRAASDDPSVLYGVTFSITEQKTAEVALRESEERQRLTLQLVPALLWRADAAGERVTVNDRWKAYTGQTEAQAQDFGWLDAIHHDDLAATTEAFRHAFATGEPLERQQRIHKTGDGYRWHLVRHVPLRDASGAITSWFGAAVDVDELHRLQERQGVLMHELQHRVRNTLAVVRSIVARTGEASPDVEHFAMHLEGRLNALARTQVVLTRAPGAGVDLETLVREELLAQAAQEGQFEVEGPEVLISAKAAEVLALAIHELATNAVKYGALCTETGRVQVRWEVEPREPRPWLRLVWRERGVRVLAQAPRRQGFGSELITTRVPYELRGEGTLEFLPGGVRCVMRFPLRPGDSILQTHAPPQPDEEDA